MKQVGVLPCSGACNVGMMSTKLALQVIAQNENVQMVCALGLPLGIERIQDMARGNEYFVTVDGCEAQCATKALAKIDQKPHVNVVINEDYKIEKNKQYNQELKMDEIIRDLNEKIRVLG
jgi:uncharacterized metal-binding protein